jgi:hypothetical protein
MDDNRHGDEHRAVRTLSRIPWFYLALLLGSLTAEMLGLGPRVVRRLDFAAVLFPWATGMLLLAVGRAGPVKNWAVPWLMSFALPVVILKFGIQLIRAWATFGNALAPVLFAFFIAVPILWYLRFLARMSPVCCPGCGKASSIPLMQIGNQDERSGNTRWCASCGEKHWRDRHGVAKQEKRTTWHDWQIRRGQTATNEAHRPSAPIGISKSQPASKSSRMEA